MPWAEQPSAWQGRQQACRDAAIKACRTLKVRFGRPLRQETGFVESLLALSGVPGSFPGFSILSRGQNTLKVAIPSRRQEGLHLLTDSTAPARPPHKRKSDL